MAKKKNKIIEVQGTKVRWIVVDGEDYISLTDISKGADDGDGAIERWLRNKNTLDFLGVWEHLYNPNFNSLEFEGIMREAGVNRFSLSVKKWQERANAIGIFAKAGRYGGTYAHQDIAFEFGSWLSPIFKLYLIKEFQRLKVAENQSLEWNLKRDLAKINYQLHTQAIKKNLIPPRIKKKIQGLFYASEADVLNLALFGMTAKEWRTQNPEKTGNMRDEATVEQLIVLVNLQNINAFLIKSKTPQAERLEQLNKIAIQQMENLMKNMSVKRLKE